MTKHEDGASYRIGPDDLIKAYLLGYFPMADSRDDPRVFWVSPERRGVLPLNEFHIPKTLKKTIKRNVFTVRVDTAFADVMLGCAEPRPGREETWINDEIFDLYCELNRRNIAHSIECWRGDQLVGGLYGVAIGGAFFGESMFSREPDASKVALAFLVARLIAGGYSLLDTQFQTEHLTRFGVVEVSKEQYLRRLEDALQLAGDFFALSDQISGEDVLQSITQTS